MKTVRDALIILIVGAALGIAINATRVATSSNGLPLNTPWPDNRKILKLDIPPSYQAGDTLLSLEQAYSLYLGGKAIFLDAREPEEYQEGHIRGAINMPFEQWDSYWETVKTRLDPEKEIVAYCGGLDCELSLFLARELKLNGFDKSYTFFGGWQKWNDARLPVETDK